MENKRWHLIKFIFIGVAILAIPIFVFAYDAIFTHPGLTREIAKFYNLTIGNNNKLSTQEINWLAKGSVDEDITPRWLNHYYNPETGQGLKGENLGWLPDKLTKSGIEIFVSTKEAVSVKNWARNQALQQSYILYGGDHTYQKALLEYAKGNKKDAFISLGNLLHFIEDMAVPDHTRSDAHADILGTGDKGSPYEIWSEKNNANGIDLALNFYNKNLEPYKFNDYEEYLENMANYSHYNFFSKDTIFDYEEPIVVKFNKINKFEFLGYNKLNIPILIRKIELNKEETYSIDNDLILSAYWENLSREAVLHGAGIIELFLKEAEALKQDKEKIALMEKQERNSMIDNILDMGIAFSPANAIQKISNNINTGIKTGGNFIKDNTISIYKKASNNLNKIVSGFVVVNNFDSMNNKLIDFTDTDKNKDATNEIKDIDDTEDEKYEKEIQLELANKNSDLEKLNIDNKNNNENKDQDEIYERDLKIENIKQKIKGLENQIKLVIDNANNPINKENNKNKIDNKISDLNNKKEIDIKEKKNNYIEKNVGGAVEYTSYNYGDVIFSEIDWKGSGENSSYEWIELYGNSSTSVNLEGWTIEKKDSNGKLSFLIGDTGDNFGNNHSISYGEYFLLERNELATSIASNKIYDGALSNNGEHLLLKDAFGNLIDEVNYINNWLEDSNDYAHSMSIVNGVWTAGIKTPKQSNIAYVKPQEEQDEIKEDNATTTKEIIYNERDIVINEIAWMGDSESVNNEWIEIYNATTTAIDLSGWSVEAEDGSPNISLNKVINVGEYFLLERTSDNSVKPISADLIYSGVLSNEGEILILKDNTNKEIDRVDSWYAGDNDTKKTMQRISASQSGILSTNWITNSGTPKAQNDLTEENVLLSYNDKDIIISEIMWSGTDASSSDEYIELRNTTSNNIDLLNWTIEIIPNNASTTIISLENTIEAGNATSTTPYFLMERTDDNVVSNISADLIYSGSLNNDGVILKLKDPSGNIIDSVDASSGWAYGDKEYKKSMERKADLDWITYGDTKDFLSDGYYLDLDNNIYIKDANNNKIKGSPKRPNSDIEKCMYNEGNVSCPKPYVS